MKMSLKDSTIEGGGEEAIFEALPSYRKKVLCVALAQSHVPVKQ